MTQWFRSWHGAPTDAKWILIARKSGSTPIVVSAVVWALFDHASQEDDRGSVAGFDAETYAAWAGIDEDEIVAIIEALNDKGIIEGGRLAAWDKRQPKREDDSRERVRAHRERQAHIKEDVTPCNADVTHGNAPEKNRADTEQNRTERETATAHAREAADILVTATWVGDDAGGVLTGLDRSFRLVPAFDQREAPVEAEKFVRWHSGSGRKKRKPPEDWYRAWLNWIKRAVNDQQRPPPQHRNGRTREPDFSGIDEWSERMDALEQRR